MSRFKTCLFLLTTSLLISGCSEPTIETAESLAAGTNTTSTEVAETTAASLFVVDHYDPERDAANDLLTTIQLATKSKKRILLEIGGKW